MARQELRRVCPATSSIQAGVQWVSCCMKYGGVAGAKRRWRGIEHQHAGRGELGREPERIRVARGGDAATVTGATVQLDRLQAGLVRHREQHQTDPARAQKAREVQHRRPRIGRDGAYRPVGASRRAASTAGSRNGGPPSAVMPGA